MCLLGWREGKNVPNFRHRLTREQQRIYDRSNATPSIKLVASQRLRQAVVALGPVLLTGDRVRVEGLAQLIADDMAATLRVPGVRVNVRGTRPSNTRGELHGLYTPADGRRRAATEAWIIPPKRGKGRAF